MLYSIAEHQNNTTTNFQIAMLVDNIFSEEQLQHIDKLFDKSSFEKAHTGIGGEAIDDPKLRRSNVSWKPYNEETNFVYDGIIHTATQINNDCYKFVLNSVEQLQFTQYYFFQQGHYNFHTDMGFCPQPECRVRKLSCVLFLEDSTTKRFTGGDFEIMIGPDSTKIEQKRGRLIVFPSFIMHRVTPVTAGVRRSVVAWFNGPMFK